MGILKLHDTSLSRAEIAMERDKHFLNLSPAEKLYALLHLNSTAVKLNGGKPLKQPQGKGIIISKPR